ncbi:MAG: LCP family protein, partial [Candidatus Kerfeldbacteria bacterium]|nr:LCP family protein [Candidatus Kerfeldbacteria bacterium]
MTPQLPSRPPVTPPTPSQPLSPSPLPPVKVQPRHHRLRWTFLSIAVLIVLVLGTGDWLAYRAISVINTRKLDNSNAKLSFLQQLTHIVTSGDEQLQGEADDRINMLLLGIGGPGHDGPYLTDTMIVVSYKPSLNQVSMLSIPRDLVVNIPGYDYRKINNVLSFGRDQKYPGGGEALTIKVVSDLLDIPIQYYGLIDFKGFQEIIDRVGGIDVTVDTAFTDYSFPDNNYGYQTIRFAKGPQHLDGTTALNFARSRHGNNGEGSDFARAARQQKIIEALKDKLLSFGTLSNPKKISDILGALGTHSQTNMEVWEMIRLAKLTGDVSRDRIINKVFEDSSTGFLKSATGTGGAYILVPRDGTYQDMKFLAQNIFLVHRAEVEAPHVAVVNATTFANLAQTMGKSISGFGLDVLKTASVKDATVGQTLILEANPGRFPAAVSFL